MATRVYVVFEKGNAIGLVRTTSPGDAIKHCTKDRFDAVVADQDHLLKYAAGDGMVVEDAKPPKPAANPTPGAAAGAAAG